MSNEWPVKVDFPIIFQGFICCAFSTVVHLYVYLCITFIFYKHLFLQANRAKADGITMLAVGVGKDIFQTELNQIASTANLVSVVRDFSSLANTVNFIRNLICTCTYLHLY